ncbi:hypothetical protein niasHT_002148 [Heterodera trifolii]|uniref:Uncharacterized protein n=1 Tax=Heterodera trifolii TaxID=157864 RepID=A0ABD2LX49_9BILA
MVLIRPLLYAFVAISAVTQLTLGTDEAIDTLRKLMNEYNTLSGPAFDVLGNLLSVSENSKLLMKLTGPAGSVLAACIEIAFKPESPTLKALATFHDWADRKFTEQNNMVEIAMNSIRVAHDLNDFDNNVDVPLAWLSDIFEIVTNPKTVRSAKQEFISACTQMFSSPKKILNYINEKVNDNCNTMPQRIMPILSELRALFAGVFWRYDEQKLTIEYNELKKTYLRVLEKFAIASEEEAQEIFIQIRDFIGDSTLNETVRLADLTLSLNKMFKGTLPEICLLRSVYEGYETKRAPILKMAEIVKVSTLKTAIIGGMCANISYAGDQERVIVEIEKLGRYVEQITGKVAKWISIEIENVWPFEMERQAKAALGIVEITDPYAYNKTANTINNAVSERGPEKIIYHVLVSQGFDRIENIWFDCEPICCHRVRQFHGINFIIFRHEMRSVGRAINAKKWFNNLQSNISEIISTNDKAPELGTLTKKIVEKVGPITSDPFYHSFLFLHVSAFSSSNCKIPTGISSGSYMGQEGFSFLEVNDHHWAPRNEECFKLFFFL